MTFTREKPWKLENETGRAGSLTCFVLMPGERAGLLLVWGSTGKASLEKYRIIQAHAANSSKTPCLRPPELLQLPGAHCLVCVLRPSVLGMAFHS